MHNDRVVHVAELVNKFVSGNLASISKNVLTLLHLPKGPEISRYVTIHSPYSSIIVSMWLRKESSAKGTERFLI